MPVVLSAVSAVVIPHSRIFVIRGNSELHLLHITDAVGPCVIALNGQTVRAAMLDRKQQRVIVGCRSVVQLSHHSVVLTLILVLQVKQTARIVVAA